MDARSSPAPARQRPSRHKSCKAAVSKALTCPGKRSKTVLLAQSSRHFPFQLVSARIYFHKHACCGNKSRSTSTAPQSTATKPPVLLPWGYFTPKAFHRLLTSPYGTPTPSEACVSSQHQRCRSSELTRTALIRSPNFSPALAATCAERCLRLRALRGHAQAEGRHGVTWSAPRLLGKKQSSWCEVHFPVLAAEFKYHIDVLVVAIAAALAIAENFT